MRFLKLWLWKYFFRCVGVFMLAHWLCGGKFWGGMSGQDYVTCFLLSFFFAMDVVDITRPVREVLSTPESAA